MIHAALVIDSAALVSVSPDGKITIRDIATSKLKLFHSRSLVPTGISVHLIFVQISICNSWNLKVSLFHYSFISKKSLFHLLFSCVNWQCLTSIWHCFTWYNRPMELLFKGALIHGITKFLESIGLISGVIVIKMGGSLFL